MIDFLAKFLVLLVLLSSQVSLYAQRNPVEQSIEMPSPEVYSQVKISNHTGVSNTGSSSVSISLAAVNALEHSQTVSLNYALSGIRASEISSNVGLGWNLDIGASLVRVVVGRPDENERGMLTFPAVSSAVQNRIAQSIGIPYDPYANSMLLEGIQGGYDEASDIYKYQVEGISGEFRFDHEGDVMFQPNNNVKVEHDPFLKWFKLIAPSGKEYVFGGQPGDPQQHVYDKSSSGSTNGAGNLDQYYINKWHLTKVSDGNLMPLLKITYQQTAYESERITECSTSESFYFCNVPNATSNVTKRTCEEVLQSIPEGHRYDDATNSVYVRIFNRVYYPQKIYSPHTGRSILFNYVADRSDVGSFSSSGLGDPLRLDKLVEYNGLNNKTVQFVQSYTTVRSGVNKFFEKKLILDQIRYLNDSQILEGKEIFEYNLPTHLSGGYASPSRITPFRDHWGFLNSLATGSHPFTQRFSKEPSAIYDFDEGHYVQIPGHISGLTRLGDLVGSKHASLKKRVLPSGVEITYGTELHTAASYYAEPTTSNGTDVSSVHVCAFDRVSCNTSASCNNSNADPNFASETYQLSSLNQYRIKFDLEYFNNDPRYPPSGEGPNHACTPGTSGPHSDREASATFYLDGQQYGPVILGTQTLNGNSTMFPLHLDLNLQDMFGANANYNGILTCAVTSIHGSAHVTLTEFPIPTGGRYEDRTVGGLRVESIEIKDLVDNTSTISQFEYSNPEGLGATSGLLIREPLAGIKSFLIDTFQANGTTYTTTIKYDSKNATADHVLDNIAGSHVVYTDVKRSRITPDEGSTEWKYFEPEVSNLGKVDLLVFAKNSAYQYTPERGSLLAKYERSTLGDLIEEKNFEYEESSFPPISGSPLVANRYFNETINFTPAGAGPGVPFYCSRLVGAAVKEGFFSYNSKVSRNLIKTTTIRDGVTSVEDRNFTVASDPYNLLLSAMLTSPTGDVSLSSFEYLVQGTSANSQAAKDLNLASLKTSTTISNQANGVSGQISKSTTQYTKVDSFGVRTNAGKMLRPFKYFSVDRNGVSRQEWAIASYTSFGAPVLLLEKDRTQYISYTYDKDRVTKKRYVNSIQDYTYHGASMLIDSYTSEQGLVQYYDFDDYSRLESVTSRGGAVVDLYSYTTYSDAQNSLKNSVKHTLNVIPTSQNPTTSLVEKTFYSGKGSPLQRILLGRGVNNGDVVYNSSFDALGRLSKTYKAFERSPSSSAYASSGTSTLLSENLYESSPLGRVVRTNRFPYGGNSYSYSANTASDYGLAANSYFKTVSTDDEGFEEISISDVFGRAIHSATSGQSGKSIRYVYDEFSNLERTYRSWPNTSAQHTILQTFDERNRLTSKLIPEEGLTQYRYDHFDRIIGEQGAFELSKGFWRGYYYDPNYDFLKFIVQLSSAPVGSFSLNQISAYEQKNYRYFSVVQSPKFGQITQYEAYHANGSRFRTDYLFDQFGRVQTEKVFDYAYLTGSSTNYPSYTTFTHDMFDQILSSTEVFRTGTKIITNQFQYNNQNQLLSENVTLDGKQQVLSEYEYDNEGRVGQLRLNPTGGSPWQSIGYDYDLQGALVSLNSFYLPEFIPGSVCNGPVFGKGDNSLMTPERVTEYDLSLELNLSPLIAENQSSSSYSLQSLVDIMSEGKVVHRMTFLDTLVSDTISEGLRDVPDFGLERHNVIRGFNYTVLSVSALKDSISFLARNFFDGQSDSINASLTFALGEIQDTIEKYHIHDFIALNSARGEQKLVSTSSSSASPPANQLFAQKIYRTNSHSYFSNSGSGIGRNDGLVSYVRSQIGTTQPFDFAYSYSQNHDNALSESNYAVFNASLSCPETYYSSIDQYRSKYVYRSGSDAMGRLHELTRYTAAGSGGGSVRSDRIDYRYYDNSKPGKLTASYEWTSHRSALYDGGWGSGIQYDASGNILIHSGSTPNKRTRFIYSKANRPSSVYSGSSVTSFYYLYDGTKLGYLEPGATDRKISYGNLETKGPLPYRWYHDNGYYDYETEKFVYHIKDYLGTPRVTFTDVNNDGLIRPADDLLESKTLYPFGMQAFGTRAAGHERTLEDFTGHDLTIEGYQGVHDMNARQYIPGLGLFGGVDPLADQYPSYTAYAYAMNNPINLIDPTGLSPRTPISFSNGGHEYAVESEETCCDFGGLARELKTVLTETLPIAVGTLLSAAIPNEGSSTDPSGSRDAGTVPGTGNEVMNPAGDFSPRAAGNGPSTPDAKGGSTGIIDMGSGDIAKGPASPKSGLSHQQPSKIISRVSKVKNSFKKFDRATKNSSPLKLDTTISHANHTTRKFSPR